MCLKDVDRARAGRSWWLLLCVSKGLVHMSACGHSCPGRDQSSPPCGLWEQAGKMPPFSSKPAHFLLALVQWVPWGAGRTGVSVLWVCSGHECQGCLGREFRDVQAMGVGTLMLWIQGCSGHGCGDAQALDAGMLTPWVPGTLVLFLIFPLPPLCEAPAAVPCPAWWHPLPALGCCPQE